MKEKYYILYYLSSWGMGTNTAVLCACAGVCRRLR